MPAYFPIWSKKVDTEGRGIEKPRYYTLSPDPKHASVAILEAHELKSTDGVKLPFNQPSGSQSPALGPLIKRTPPTKAKPAGPTVKIQQTTLRAFKEIGDAGQPWSDYFRSAHDCWSRPKLRLNNEEADAESGALQAAIEHIDEKRTVLVAYRTPEGKLPGDVPEYVRYLQEVLAATKYATGAVPVVQDKTCTLCGRPEVAVYPNALRGAGINLANLDRDGAFSALDVQAAWKSYALCIGCADLLYVYWNHLAVIT